jgi:hypothetical protein
MVASLGGLRICDEAVGPGVVLALVVVDGGAPSVCINSLLVGTPAWMQAVEHAQRHLRLGHHVVVCGPACTV